MNYDTFEEIVATIEEKIDELEEAQWRLARLEASFKGYEASSKKAFMDAGMSAVKADTEMRAAGRERMDERLGEWPVGAWERNYATVQEQSIFVEKLKRKIKVLEMRFEALRSMKADARRVV